jgi:hypothetical protein
MIALKASIGIVEQLLLDFDFIELVLAFRDLTWGEFASALALILAWKWAAGQIERVLAYRLRLWLADRLARLSVQVRPA